MSSCDKRGNNIKPLKSQEAKKNKQIHSTKPNNGIKRKHSNLPISNQNRSLISVNYGRTSSNLIDRNEIDQNNDKINYKKQSKFNPSKKDESRSIKLKRIESSTGFLYKDHHGISNRVVKDRYLIKLNNLFKTTQVLFSAKKFDDKIKKKATFCINDDSGDDFINPLVENTPVISPNNIKFEMNVKTDSPKRKKFDNKFDNKFDKRVDNSHCSDPQSQPQNHQNTPSQPRNHQTSPENDPNTTPISLFKAPKIPPRYKLETFHTHPHYAREYFAGLHKPRAIPNPIMQVQKAPTFQTNSKHSLNEFIHNDTHRKVLKLRMTAEVYFNYFEQTKQFLNEKIKINREISQQLTQTQAQAPTPKAPKSSHRPAMDIDDGKTIHNNIDTQNPHILPPPLENITKPLEKKYIKPLSKLYIRPNIQKGDVKRLFFETKLHKFYLYRQYISHHGPTGKKSLDLSDYTSNGMFDDDDNNNNHENEKMLQIEQNFAHQTFTRFYSLFRESLLIKLSQHQLSPAGKRFLTQSIAVYDKYGSTETAKLKQTRIKNQFFNFVKNDNFLVKQNNTKLIDQFQTSEDIICNNAFDNLYSSILQDIYHATKTGGNNNNNNNNNLISQIYPKKNNFSTVFSTLSDNNNTDIGLNSNSLDIDIQKFGNEPYKAFLQYNIPEKKKHGDFVENISKIDGTLLLGGDDNNNNNNNSNNNNDHYFNNDSFFNKVLDEHNRGNYNKVVNLFEMNAIRSLQPIAMKLWILQHLFVIQIKILEFNLSSKNNNNDINNNKYNFYQNQKNEAKIEQNNNYFDKHSLDILSSPHTPRHVQESIILTHLIKKYPHLESVKNLIVQSDIFLKFLKIQNKQSDQRNNDQSNNDQDGGLIMDEVDIMTRLPPLHLLNPFTLKTLTKNMKKPYYGPNLDKNHKNTLNKTAKVYPTFFDKKYTKSIICDDIIEACEELNLSQQDIINILTFCGSPNDEISTKFPQFTFKNSHKIPQNGSQIPHSTPTQTQRNDLQTYVDFIHKPPSPAISLSYRHPLYQHPYIHRLNSTHSLIMNINAQLSAVIDFFQSVSKINKQNSQQKIQNDDIFFNIFNQNFNHSNQTKSSINFYQISNFVSFSSQDGQNGQHFEDIFGQNFSNLPINFIQNFITKFLKFDLFSPHFPTQIDKDWDMIHHYIDNSSTFLSIDKTSSKNPNSENQNFLQNSKNDTNTLKNDPKKITKIFRTLLFQQTLLDLYRKLSSKQTQDCTFVDEYHNLQGILDQRVLLLGETLGIHLDYTQTAVLHPGESLDIGSEFNNPQKNNQIEPQILQISEITKRNLNTIQTILLQRQYGLSIDKIDDYINSTSKMSTKTFEMQRNNQTDHQAINLLETTLLSTLPRHDLDGSVHIGIVRNEIEEINEENHQNLSHFLKLLRHDEFTLTKLKWLNNVEIDELKQTLHINGAFDGDLGDGGGGAMEKDGSDGGKLEELDNFKQNLIQNIHKRSSTISKLISSFEEVFGISPRLYTDVITVKHNSPPHFPRVNKRTSVSSENQNQNDGNNDETFDSYDDYYLGSSGDTANDLGTYRQLSDPDNINTTELNFDMNTKTADEKEKLRKNLINFDFEKRFKNIEQLSPLSSYILYNSDAYIPYINSYYIDSYNNNYNLVQHFKKQTQNNNQNDFFVYENDNFAKKNDANQTMIEIFPFLNSPYRTTNDPLQIQSTVSMDTIPITIQNPKLAQAIIHSYSQTFKKSNQFQNLDSPPNNDKFKHSLQITPLQNSPILFLRQLITNHLQSAYKQDTFSTKINLESLTASRRSYQELMSVYLGDKTFDSLALSQQANSHFSFFHQNIDHTKRLRGTTLNDIVRGNRLVKKGVGNIHLVDYYGTFFGKSFLHFHSLTKKLQQYRKLFRNAAGMANPQLFSAYQFLNELDGNNDVEISLLFNDQMEVGKMNQIIQNDSENDQNKDFSGNNHHYGDKNEHDNTIIGLKHAIIKLYSELYDHDKDFLSTTPNLKRESEEIRNKFQKLSLLEHNLHQKIQQNSKYKLFLKNRPLKMSSHLLSYKKQYNWLQSRFVRRIYNDHIYQSIPFSSNNDDDDNSISPLGIKTPYNPTPGAEFIQTTVINGKKTHHLSHPDQEKYQFTLSIPLLSYSPSIHPSSQLLSLPPSRFNIHNRQTTKLSNLTRYDLPFDLIPSLEISKISQSTQPIKSSHTPLRDTLPHSIHPTPSSLLTYHHFNSRKLWSMLQVLLEGDLDHNGGNLPPQKGSNWQHKLLAHEIITKSFFQNGLFNQLIDYNTLLQNSYDMTRQNLMDIMETQRDSYKSLFMGLYLQNNIAGILQNLAPRRKLPKSGKKKAKDQYDIIDLGEQDVISMLNRQDYHIGAQILANGETLIKKSQNNVQDNVQNGSNQFDPDDITDPFGSFILYLQYTSHGYESGNDEVVKNDHNTSKESKKTNIQNKIVQNNSDLSLSPDMFHNIQSYASTMEIHALSALSYLLTNNPKLSYHDFTDPTRLQKIDRFDNFGNNSDNQSFNLENNQGNVHKTLISWLEDHIEAHGDDIQKLNKNTPTNISKKSNKSKSLLDFDFLVMKNTTSPTPTKDITPTLSNLQNNSLFLLPRNIFLSYIHETVSKLLLLRDFHQSLTLSREVHQHHHDLTNCVNEYIPLFERYLLLTSSPSMNDDNNSPEQALVTDGDSRDLNNETNINKNYQYINTFLKSVQNINKINTEFLSIPVQDYIIKLGLGLTSQTLYDITGHSTLKAPYAPEELIPEEFNYHHFPHNTLISAPNHRQNYQNIDPDLLLPLDKSKNPQRFPLSSSTTFNNTHYTTSKLNNDVSMTGKPSDSYFFSQKKYQHSSAHYQKKLTSAYLIWSQNDPKAFSNTIQSYNLSAEFNPNNLADIPHPRRIQTVRDWKQLPFLTKWSKDYYSHTATSIQDIEDGNVNHVKLIPPRQSTVMQSRIVNIIADIYGTRDLPSIYTAQHDFYKTIIDVSAVPRTNVPFMKHHHYSSSLEINSDGLIVRAATTAKLEPSELPTLHDFSALIDDDSSDITHIGSYNVKVNGGGDDGDGRDGAGQGVAGRKRNKKTSMIDVSPQLEYLTNLRLISSNFDQKHYISTLFQLDDNDPYSNYLPTKKTPFLLKKQQLLSLYPQIERNNAKIALNLGVYTSLLQDMNNQLGEIEVLGEENDIITDRRKILQSNIFTIIESVFNSSTPLLYANPDVLNIDQGKQHQYQTQIDNQHKNAIFQKHLTSTLNKSLNSFTTDNNTSEDEPITSKLNHDGNSVNHFSEIANIPSDRLLPSFRPLSKYISSSTGYSDLLDHSSSTSFAASKCTELQHGSVEFLKMYNKLLSENHITHIDEYSNEFQRVLFRDRLVLYKYWLKKEHNDVYVKLIKDKTLDVLPQVDHNGNKVDYPRGFTELHNELMEKFNKEGNFVLNSEQVEETILHRQQNPKVNHRDHFAEVMLFSDLSTQSPFENLSRHDFFELGNLLVDYKEKNIDFFIQNYGSVQNSPKFGKFGKLSSQNELSTNAFIPADLTPIFYNLSDEYSSQVLLDGRYTKRSIEYYLNENYHTLSMSFLSQFMASLLTISTISQNLSKNDQNDDQSSSNSSSFETMAVLQPLFKSLLGFTPAVEHMYQLNAIKHMINGTTTLPNLVQQLSNLNNANLTNIKHSGTPTFSNSLESSSNSLISFPLADNVNTYANHSSDILNQIILPIFTAQRKINEQINDKINNSQQSHNFGNHSSLQINQLINPSQFLTKMTEILLHENANPPSLSQTPLGNSVLSLIQSIGSHLHLAQGLPGVLYQSYAADFNPVIPITAYTDAIFDTPLLHNQYGQDSGDVGKGIRRKSKNGSHNGFQRVQSNAAIVDLEPVHHCDSDIIPSIDEELSLMDHRTEYSLGLLKKSISNDDYIAGIQKNVTNLDQFQIPPNGNTGQPMPNLSQFENPIPTLKNSKLFNRTKFLVNYDYDTQLFLNNYDTNFVTEFPTELNKTKLRLKIQKTQSLIHDQITKNQIKNVNKKYHKFRQIYKAHFENPSDSNPPDPNPLPLPHQDKYIINNPKSTLKRPKQPISFPAQPQSESPHETIPPPSFPTTPFADSPQHPSLMQSLLNLTQKDAILVLSALNGNIAPKKAQNLPLINAITGFIMQTSSPKAIIEHANYIKIDKKTQNAVLLVDSTKKDEMDKNVQNFSQNSHPGPQIGKNALNNPYGYVTSQGDVLAQYLNPQNNQHFSLFQQLCSYGPNFGLPIDTILHPYRKTNNIPLASAVFMQWYNNQEAFGEFFDIFSLLVGKSQLFLQTRTKRLPSGFNTQSNRDLTQRIHRNYTPELLLHTTIDIHSHLPPQVGDKHTSGELLYLNQDLLADVFNHFTLPRQLPMFINRDGIVGRVEFEKAVRRQAENVKFIATIQAYLHMTQNSHNNNNNNNNNDNNEYNDGNINADIVTLRQFEHVGNLFDFAFENGEIGNKFRQLIRRDFFENNFDQFGNNFEKSFPLNFSSPSNHYRLPNISNDRTIELNNLVVDTFLNNNYSNDLITKNITFIEPSKKIQFFEKNMNELNHLRKTNNQFTFFYPNNFIEKPIIPDNYLALGNNNSLLSPDEKKTFALTRVVEILTKNGIFSPENKNNQNKNNEIILDNIMKNFSKLVFAPKLKPNPATNTFVNNISATVYLSRGDELNLVRNKSEGMKNTGAPTFYLDQNMSESIFSPNIPPQSNSYVVIKPDLNAYTMVKNINIKKLGKLKSLLQREKEILGTKDFLQKYSFFVQIGSNNNDLNDQNGEGNQGENVVYCNDIGFEGLNDDDKNDKNDKNDRNLMHKIHSIQKGSKLSPFAATKSPTFDPFRQSSSQFDNINEEEDDNGYSYQIPQPNQQIVTIRNRPLPLRTNRNNNNIQNHNSAKPRQSQPTIDIDDNSDDFSDVLFDDEIDLDIQLNNDFIPKDNDGKDTSSRRNHVRKNRSTKIGFTNRAMGTTFVFKRIGTTESLIKPRNYSLRIVNKEEKSEEKSEFFQSILTKPKGLRLLSADQFNKLFSTSLHNKNNKNNTNNTNVMVYDIKNGKTRYIPRRQIIINNDFDRFSKTFTKNHVFLVDPLTVLNKLLLNNNHNDMTLDDIGNIYSMLDSIDFLSLEQKFNFGSTSVAKSSKNHINIAFNAVPINPQSSITALDNFHGYTTLLEPTDSARDEFLAKTNFGGGKKDRKTPNSRARSIIHSYNADYPVDNSQFESKIEQFGSLPVQIIAQLLIQRKKIQSQKLQQQRNSLEEENEDQNDDDDGDEEFINSLQPEELALFTASLKNVGLSLFEVVNRILNDKATMSLFDQFLGNLDNQQQSLQKNNHNDSIRTIGGPHQIIKPNVRNNNHYKSIGNDDDYVHLRGGVFNLNFEVNLDNRFEYPHLLPSTHTPQSPITLYPHLKLTQYNSAKKGIVNVDRNNIQIFSAVSNVFKSELDQCQMVHSAGSRKKINDIVVIDTKTTQALEKENLKQFFNIFNTFFGKDSVTNQATQALSDFSYVMDEVLTSLKNNNDFNNQNENIRLVNNVQKFFFELLHLQFKSHNNKTTLPDSNKQKMNQSSIFNRLNTVEENCLNTISNFGQSGHIIAASLTTMILSIHLRSSIINNINFDDFSNEDDQFGGEEINKNEFILKNLKNQIQELNNLAVWWFQNGNNNEQFFISLLPVFTEIVKLNTKYFPTMIDGAENQKLVKLLLKHTLEIQDNSNNNNYGKKSIQNVDKLAQKDQNDIQKFKNIPTLFNLMKTLTRTQLPSSPSLSSLNTSITTQTSDALSQNVYMYTHLYHSIYSIGQRLKFAQTALKSKNQKLYPSPVSNYLKSTPIHQQTSQDALFIAKQILSPINLDKKFVKMILMNYDLQFLQNGIEQNGIEQNGTEQNGNQNLGSETMSQRVVQNKSQLFKMFDYYYSQIPLSKQKLLLPRRLYGFYDDSQAVDDNNPQFDSNIDQNVDVNAGINSKTPQITQSTQISPETVQAINKPDPSHVHHFTPLNDDDFDIPPAQIEQNSPDTPLRNPYHFANIARKNRRRWDNWGARRPIRLLERFALSTAVDNIHSRRRLSPFVLAFISNIHVNDLVVPVQQYNEKKENELEFDFEKLQNDFDSNMIKEFVSSNQIKKNLTMSQSSLIQQVINPNGFNGNKSTIFLKKKASYFNQFEPHWYVLDLEYLSQKLNDVGEGGNVDTQGGAHVHDNAKDVQTAKLHSTPRQDLNLLKLLSPKTNIIDWDYETCQMINWDKLDEVFNFKGHHDILIASQQYSGVIGNLHLELLSMLFKPNGSNLGYEQSQFDKFEIFRGDFGKKINFVLKDLIFNMIKNSNLIHNCSRNDIQNYSTDLENLLIAKNIKLQNNIEIENSLKDRKNKNNNTPFIQPNQSTNENLSDVEIIVDYLLYNIQIDFSNLKNDNNSNNNINNNNNNNNYNNNNNNNNKKFTKISRKIYHFNLDKIQFEKISSQLFDMIKNIEKISNIHHNSPISDDSTQLSSQNSTKNQILSVLDTSTWNTIQDWSYFGSKYVKSDLSTKMLHKSVFLTPYYIQIDNFVNQNKHNSSNCVQKSNKFQQIYSSLEKTLQHSPQNRSNTNPSRHQLVLNHANDNYTQFLQTYTKNNIKKQFNLDSNSQINSNRPQRLHLDDQQFLPNPKHIQHLSTLSYSTFSSLPGKNDYLSPLDHFRDALRNNDQIDESNNTENTKNTKNTENTKNTKNTPKPPQSSLQNDVISNQLNYSRDLLSLSDMIFKYNNNIILNNPFHLPSALKSTLSQTLQRTLINNTSTCDHILNVIDFISDEGLHNLSLAHNDIDLNLEDEKKMKKNRLFLSSLFSHTLKHLHSEGSLQVIINQAHINMMDIYHPGLVNLYFDTIQETLSNTQNENIEQSTIPHNHQLISMTNIVSDITQYKPMLIDFNDLLHCLPEAKIKINTIRNFVHKLSFLIPFYNISKFNLVESIHLFNSSYPARTPDYSTHFQPTSTKPAPFTDPLISFQPLPVHTTNNHNGHSSSNDALDWNGESNIFDTFSPQTTQFDRNNDNIARFVPSPSPQLKNHSKYALEELFNGSKYTYLMNTPRNGDGSVGGIYDDLFNSIHPTITLANDIMSTLSPLSLHLNDFESNSNIHDDDSVEMEKFGTQVGENLQKIKQTREKLELINSNAQVSLKFAETLYHDLLQPYLSSMRNFVGNVIDIDQEIDKNDATPPSISTIIDPLLTTYEPRKVKLKLTTLFPRHVDNINSQSTLDEYSYNLPTLNTVLNMTTKTLYTLSNTLAIVPSVPACAVVDTETEPYSDNFCQNFPLVDGHHLVAGTQNSIETPLSRSNSIQRKNLGHKQQSILTTLLLPNDNLDAISEEYNTSRSNHESSLQNNTPHLQLMGLLSSYQTAIMHIGLPLIRFAQHKIMLESLFNQDNDSLNHLDGELLRQMSQKKNISIFANNLELMIKINLNITKSSLQFDNNIAAKDAWDIAAQLYDQSNYINLKNSIDADSASKINDNGVTPNDFAQVGMLFKLLSPGNSLGQSVRKINFEQNLDVLAELNKIVQNGNKNEQNDTNLLPISNIELMLSQNNDHTDQINRLNVIQHIQNIESVLESGQNHSDGDQK